MNTGITLEIVPPCEFEVKEDGRKVNRGGYIIPK